MNKLMALMTAGSMALSLTPVAFAQSASSLSSSSVSSASSVSSSSVTSSSMSSSSVTTSSLTSSSVSSASVYSRPPRSQASTPTIQRGRGRVTASVSSQPRSSRSSVQTRGEEVRNERARLVPEECQDVYGRARAMCVQRLMKPTERSSRSSVSSAVSSQTMTGSTVTTNDQLLRRLLGVGNTQGSTDLMRMICGLTTGKLDSSCADGSNMTQFNRNLHDWYVNLGQALTLFMRSMNSNTDTSSNYFWNNSLFPFGTTGTGGTVKGWSFMNETDTTPMLNRAGGARDQSAMWEACEGREGRSKARCMREYMNQQQTGGTGARLNP